MDDVARLVQEDIMDFVAKASHGEMNEVEEGMGGVVGEELVGDSENEALVWEEEVDAAILMVALA